MNALNAMAVKVSACGVAAVAVTLFASYAFVVSTAVVRTTAAPTHVVAGETSTRLAQAGSAGLLQ